MGDKDRDIEVESKHDAWIGGNVDPNNYTVKENGEKVGEVTAWTDEQAQDKAERGDYRRD